MLASLLTVTLILGGAALLSWPLGRFMAALFSGRYAKADGLFARIAGSSQDQDWKAYSVALLVFNAVMFAFVFALLSLQHLLPLALVVALSLAPSGVPMTLEGAAQVTTLEGAAQTIARGPAAAFVAIKQLGTNGGGLFGPNSTHPFENPTLWANFIELFAIIIIPMACGWMFGRMIGRIRHAGVIFGVMAALLLVKITAVLAFEATPAQAFVDLPIEQTAGNLEGKELRIGATTGPLWAA